MNRSVMVSSMTGTRNTTKKSTATKASGMTDDHKAALALGREQSRKVAAYLGAIDTKPAKRGRRPDPAKMAAELAEIPAKLADASPLERLELAQRELNLTESLAELANEAEPVDLTELEAGFVAVAAEYAERKGITRAAFRAVGVPASVLTQAGITR